MTRATLPPKPARPAALRHRIAAAVMTAAALLVGAVSAPAPAAAEAVAETAGPRVFPVTPTLKPDGGRWRLGYLQGGDYADYPIILSAIIEGLATLGWLPEPTLPDPHTHTAEEVWRYLVEHGGSDYVEFVDDGFYSPGNFDAAQRPATRAALVERLNAARDIDLMIAMGTWAGQDLAQSTVNVPTIVASTSDPIASGIIDNAEDSGHDHIHAKVEPQRYERQVQLFHDIVPYRSLGIVYEDSPEGRTFGGVAAVESMARELGFAVQSCDAPFNDVTAEQAAQGAIACYQRLAPSVDAIYVTVHRGVTAASLTPIVQALLDAQVPSFSMLGSEEVRRGVLMSMAQADYKPVGLFHAEVIARIFHGASPRELSQIWLSPAEIAINLKTAELIGFDPPIDILLASDEVYDSIGDTSATSARP